MRTSILGRNVSVGLMVFAAVLLVAVSATAGAGEKPAKGGPLLVISQPTFEAGKIIQGEEVTHTFVVRNKGNQDLLIKSVKPG